MTHLNLVRLLNITFLSVVSFLVQSCSSTNPEVNHVPRTQILNAEIPGIPHARFWGDGWPKESIERLNSHSEEDLKTQFSEIYNTEHHYLTISFAVIMPESFQNNLECRQLHMLPLIYLFTHSSAG